MRDFVSPLLICSSQSITTVIEVKLSKKKYPVTKLRLLCNTQFLNWNPLVTGIHLKLSLTTRLVSCAWFVLPLLTCTSQSRDAGGGGEPWPQVFGIFLKLIPTKGRIMPTQGCRPWGCRGCHGTPRARTHFFVQKIGMKVDLTNFGLNGLGTFI